jgi:hypothetical protein
MYDCEVSIIKRATARKPAITLTWFLMQFGLGSTYLLAVLPVFFLSACPRQPTKSPPTPASAQTSPPHAGSASSSPLRTPDDFPLRGFVFPSGAAAYQTNSSHWRDRNRPELTAKGVVNLPEDKLMFYAVGFRSDLGWEAVKKAVEAEAAQYDIQHFTDQHEVDRPGIHLLKQASWESADRRITITLTYFRRKADVVQPAHDGYELYVIHPLDGKLQKSAQPH